MYIHEVHLVQFMRHNDEDGILILIYTPQRELEQSSKGFISVSRPAARSSTRRPDTSMSSRSQKSSQELLPPTVPSGSLSSRHMLRILTLHGRPSLLASVMECFE